MSAMEAGITIALMAAGTVFTRFLPFLCFPAGKKAPKTVRYLGKVLPGALAALLVVYCFRSLSLTVYPYGLGELIAGAGTMILHLLKKNTLLSIGGGTLLYILLVNFVF